MPASKALERQTTSGFSTRSQIVLGSCLCANGSAGSVPLAAAPMIRPRSSQRGPSTPMNRMGTVQAAGLPADLHLDRDGQNAMVTFRDPDNIQWELFED